MALDLEPTRTCPRCNGEKTTLRKGFEFEGKVYPDKIETCHGCQGAGSFSSPDWKQIVVDITTSRGNKDGKRRIRASMTSTGKSAHAARAYYCWRLARFHGGKDVTMPMMADLFIRSDPYKKELDLFADELARTFFGTDMVAALTWGKALGYI